MSTSLYRTISFRPGRSFSTKALALVFRSYGLTLSDLEDILQVSRPTASAFASRKLGVEPSRFDVVRLARGIGCPPSALRSVPGARRHLKRRSLRLDAERRS